jgi:hypothetical protein
VFLANAGDLPDKVATSALYLVIGLVIMGLLTGVARTATRVVPPAPYTPPAGGQGSRPDQTQVMPPQPGYDQYGQRGPDRRDYY